MLIAVIVLLVLLLATVLAAWLRSRSQCEALRARYSGISSVEEAVERAKTELARITAEAAQAVAEHRRQQEQLGREYGSARSTYDRLRHEVSLLEENLEDISYGVYRPHYSFDSSEKYREELELIRFKQKGLIKSGEAAVCSIEWQVGGSKREGARMQKQYLKLMLRAFNGEGDAAVAKVTWNNMVRMEERVNKACQSINELGGVMHMSITPAYSELKIAELRLEFETEEKKHAEVEEQRRVKEQMREEERAVREAERAKQEAEDEETRYRNALERARAEMAKAEGEALTQLELKIAQLDQALEKARELKDKATSMAQLTRSGHVYVISNLGSFGENVFKVGMTRRLEPMDRIRELGDASVPFDFDVHAMVYSVDAPTLEGEFHTFFEAQRINLVNPRKEFFAVSIEQLEAFVRHRNLNLQLTKLAEAREYRETLALRQSARGDVETSTAAPAIQFPASL